MFGYITIDPGTLQKAAAERYKGFYCGLCRALKRRYGNISRMTLSNDMTFLFILLSSLYEPEEAASSGRCALHPLKSCSFLQTSFSDYAADMNIALSYHKCMDNWQDDRSAAALAQAKLLQDAYRRMEKIHPQKCGLIGESLARIARLEKEAAPLADSLANETGRMLGEIFAFQEDYWAGTLRAMGEALGRFIYLMDAYEDLPADIRKKRFNPLAAMHKQEQYELIVKDSLSMLMGECSAAFELLPLEKDVDILRNVVYAGVWTRYSIIQQRRDRRQKKPAPRSEADT